MSNAQVLSDSPRIMLLRGFLSNEERLHLLRLMEGRSSKSTVVDNATGKSVEHDHRTGHLTMLGAAEDPTIKAIEVRVSRATGTRVEQGEPIQIIGYRRGQQYKPHHDWFDPSLPGSALHMNKGGQRIHTLMMYLLLPEKGGETYFPKLDIKVRPEAGMAIMWDNTLVDGHIDRRTEHCGLPVKAGHKVVATRWIRERAFDGSENALSNGELAEKLCAQDINRVLKSYNCELRARPHLMPGGKLNAQAKIHFKES